MGTRQESATMKQQIIDTTIDALNSINHIRLFKSERGFQGRLFCELQSILDSSGIVPEDSILEMEYQKSSRHSTKQRPDIILHIPTEVSGEEVYKNNFAVWALKREATKKGAIEDFEKLDKMSRDLSYPIGFFININSDRHHLENYKGDYPDRIIAFAVRLNSGIVSLKQASILNDKVLERHFISEP